MPFRPSVALLAALLLACAAEPPAGGPDAAPAPDAATADAPPDSQADSSSPGPDAAAPDVAQLDALAPDAAPDVAADAAPDSTPDVRTDAAPACTTASECGGDRYCYMGRCVRTCVTPAGTPTGADCDGNDANGCETPLGTNAHCGGCGNPCAAPLECFPIRAGSVITGYRCM